MANASYLLPAMFLGCVVVCHLEAPFPVVLSAPPHTRNRHVRSPFYTQAPPATVKHLRSTRRSPGCMPRGASSTCRTRRHLSAHQATRCLTRSAAMHRATLHARTLDMVHGCMATRSDAIYRLIRFGRHLLLSSRMHNHCVMCHAAWNGKCLGARPYTNSAGPAIGVAHTIMR